MLTAPKGSGSLLCCQLSPHAAAYQLAVAGENASAAVFDLRGDGLVSHRLSAAVGCFTSGDAVTSVAWHPTREALLYCASGCEVTAWDLRMLPMPGGAGAAHASTAAVAGAGAGAAGAAASAGEAGAAATGGTASAAGSGAAAGEGASSSATQSAGPVHRYVFNCEEVNHIAVNRRGTALAAADDSGQIQVIDISNATSHGGKLLKTLKGGHSNICCNAVFRAGPGGHRTTRHQSHFAPLCLEFNGTRGSGELHSQAPQGFDVRLMTWRAKFSRL